MLTPRGVMESRRLPGSGAGPSPDRMMIGSEGTLGYHHPGLDASAGPAPDSAHPPVSAFPACSDACAAVRAISQSGLFPSNCRLLDPAEAMLNGVGDGTRPHVLVLAFESADHPSAGLGTAAPWSWRRTIGGSWDQAVQSTAP